ncbi:MAG TPA: hypothetical protein VGX25_06120 [Actinophytocola sp.]|uniref:hypothetical protein n=1 Tax=Actinophytocola sp. TaxID=1872138 RepID=UPI002DDC96BE|nr:hypothetical protein [Actinophytocola sp.]HEV2778962.1 hypothetical protein [Actinophytocola sp.]
MTFTSCPDCGEIAEVIDRFVLPSTDGPVEHVRTQCLRRHFYWCHWQMSDSID